MPLLMVFWKCKIKKVVDEMVDYEYYKQALLPVQKPCAFLEVQALTNNIDQIKRKAANKKIRIASKSIRSVGVLQDIFSMSSQFQGVMCYTADEALYLYEQGFDDLLVAYPTWDLGQLREICHLTKNGATITLMIDSLAHVEHLESIAHQDDGKFLVCIDIDLTTNIVGLHFGVYRSSIKTITDVMQMIHQVSRVPNLTLDGLMGYEAQIAGVVDAAPNQFFKNNIIRMLKRLSSKHIKRKREQIIELMEKEDISVRFINGGGTGSLQQTAQEEHVTEVTVGSGFFTSHLFDKYKDFSFEPAVGFALEITRIPKETVYTCLGGGYVASGAMAQDKLPEVYLPKGAKLTANEGAGEVQTPVIYKGPIKLHHGDPIIFRHSKAGELCERFRHLYLIEHGKVVNKMTTYRGDGKCFL